jgi:hypothetical protein
MMVITSILVTVVLAGILLYGFTRRERKVILFVGLFVALFVWFFSQTYTRMLYASTPRDLSGNIQWSYELADRLQEATAMGVVSVVFMLIYLGLLVYEYVRDVLRVI